ncbi:hypothetical protein ACOMHN_066491 [Nucella lapillus]
MSRPPRRNIDNRTNISPDKSSRPSSPISGSSTSASGGGGGGGKRKGRGRDKRRNNRGGRSGRSRERDIESAPLNNPGSSSQAAKEESAALTSRTSQSTDEKKDAKKSSENSCSLIRRWLWKSHKTTGEVFGFLGVITLIATVVYLMATNDEQKVRMVFGVIGLMIFAVFSFLFSWWLTTRRDSSLASTSLAPSRLILCRAIIHALRSRCFTCLFSLGISARSSNRRQFERVHRGRYSASVSCAAPFVTLRVVSGGSGRFRACSEQGGCIGCGNGVVVIAVRGSVVSGWGWWGEGTLGWFCTIGNTGVLENGNRSHHQ